MPIVGGIEAGGSKFVCAVGSQPDDLQVGEVPTTTPEETIKRTVAFFQEHQPVSAIGLGSFGPIDPNPTSPTFGYITATPKLAWRNFNFAGAIRDSLGVKVAFDTDVNAAALGEFRWGAAQHLDTFLYLTVGTGIGGGGMVNGRLMHGRTHPEMGHIRIPHDRDQDPFPGCCPFHGDCLEGLACAPAIRARWGQAGETLPDDHPAWDLEAHYLALGIAGWICTLSPQRIVLGGGVLRRKKLYRLVESKVATLLNDYVEAPEIVPPLLGARAGVSGAIALALTL
ncbi:MAG TPA: ROK family protein [Bryobacteraceae bacterium]|jgi:fructokinase|nr:ROK family protein [Bryobacteraceae bacterium]